MQLFNIIFLASIRGRLSFIATYRANSGPVDSDIENYHERMIHIVYIEGNNQFESQVLFVLPTANFMFENLHNRKIERVIDMEITTQNNVKFFELFVTEIIV